MLEVCPKQEHEFFGNEVAGAPPVKGLAGVYARFVAVVALAPTWTRSSMFCRMRSGVMVKLGE